MLGQRNGFSNGDARRLGSKRAKSRAGDEPRREHRTLSGGLGALEDEGFPSPPPKRQGVIELLAELFWFVGQAPILVFEIGEALLKVFYAAEQFMKQIAVCFAQVVGDR